VDLGINVVYNFRMKLEPEGKLLNLNCPNEKCGKPIPGTLREWQQNTSPKCPNCGNSFELRIEGNEQDRPVES
jgi:predicted RNA-binding Zn-ribbon protein involved in translation (DUF1610 family)